MDNTSLTTYDKLVNKIEAWYEILILQLPNVTISLVIVILAYLFSGYIKRLIYRFTFKTTSNITIANLAAKMSSFLVGLFTLLMVLTVMDLGDTINKILATAGVLGLAVGLALQDPMNNLFSGIMISVREMYKIGDLVESNGYTGTIMGIDLRVTKLKLPTGELVVIPNKEVVQKPLKNFTHSGERRIDIECGVSYSDDLILVEKVALAAIRSLTQIDQNKPIEFIYTDFGASSINFKVRFWIDASIMIDYLNQKSEGIKKIKEAFDQNNISIPFPITTLNLGNVSERKWKNLVSPPEDA